MGYQCCSLLSRQVISPFYSPRTLKITYKCDNASGIAPVNTVLNTLDLRSLLIRSSAPYGNPPRTNV